MMPPRQCSHFGTAPAAAGTGILPPCRHISRFFGGCGVSNICESPKMLHDALMILRYLSSGKCVAGKVCPGRFVAQFQVCFLSHNMPSVTGAPFPNPPHFNAPLPRKTYCLLALALIGLNGLPRAHTQTRHTSRRQGLRPSADAGPQGRRGGGTSNLHRLPALLLVGESAALLKFFGAGVRSLAMQGSQGYARQRDLGSASQSQSLSQSGM